MREIIFCCDEKITSAFCPHCGTSIEDADKNGDTPYPYEFTTYLHGGYDDDDRIEMLENLGIDDEDTSWNAVLDCDREVGIIFELQEDGRVDVIGVEYNNKKYALEL